MEHTHPEVYHCIDSNRLTLAKLGKWVFAMTNGCNGAHKFNKMLVETMKNESTKRKVAHTEMVGEVITHAISAAATAVDTTDNIP